VPTVANFPSGWTGWWVAHDGKALLIERKHEQVLVTVAPARGAKSYSSVELLAGGTKQIEQLPASCFVDDHGRRYLEIEAGTAELGPTYRIYPVVESREGQPLGTGEYSQFVVAHDSVPVADLILAPNTSIGLYDDYEDDLGVPWAMPLAPLRYAGPA
jgi:hypothetical protein